MSGEANRASLAADQAKLVEALAGRGGDVPSGFDEDRVRLAARMLLAKRRKGVANTWRGLATSLDGRFVELFDSFAAQASPHPDGPAADGLAFAGWLDAREMLPDSVVRAFIRASLVRRRPIGVVVRRTEERLWVGIHLPLIGAWLLRVPWLRRRPVLPMMTPPSDAVECLEARPGD